MIRGLEGDIPGPEEHSMQRIKSHAERADDSPTASHDAVSVRQCDDMPPRARRTPRVSVVVVLPENHVVSPDTLLEGLRLNSGSEVDVLVACAGQPANLSALQRCVRDAQFLLAPAGTAPERLRELAMEHASGDIVTLLSGARLSPAGMTDRQLFKTS
jgi:hypothetical protein